MKNSTRDTTIYVASLLLTPLPLYPSIPFEEGMTELSKILGTCLFGGIFLWFITFVPFLVHISKYDYDKLED